MRPSISPLALAALTLHAVSALTVRPETPLNPSTLLADTNRDGVVDSLDVDARTVWTDARGALILPNIADTDRRCSLLITDAMADALLDTCHDAADNVLRDSSLLAPVLALPNPVPDGVAGGISLTPDLGAKNTRVFVRRGEAWVYVNPANATFFSANELRAGLTLGVDARDVRRPNGWDGHVSLSLKLSSGSSPPSASDSVALRVAPLLTHHHAQRAVSLLATLPSVEVPNNAALGAFVTDLGAAAKAAGGPAPLSTVDTYDRWTQDFFEPAYASMPGPDGGVVSVRVNIRSFQNFRTTGRVVFSALRGPGVGAVQSLEYGQTRDSHGNLETIPPHAGFPAGRIIMGVAPWERPRILPFLEAQGVQRPLELDTAWLMVGHVDEFLQFLPAPHAPLGFVLMVDDPVLGLSMLDGLPADTRAVSRPAFPYDTGCMPNTTVGDVLARPGFRKQSLAHAAVIEKNLAIIKNATGLGDGEIIRLPALFANATNLGLFDCRGDGSRRRRATERFDIVQAVGGPQVASLTAAEDDDDGDNNGIGSDVAALWPGMVNGVVVTPDAVVAPNPWGPVVDGEDVFAAAARGAYARARFNVTFMDDWFSHHVGLGEVHCGSNSVREVGRWW